jgi:UDP-3-O-[3-hydroxymyristoyl] glucosamine N-acyltransferase
MRVSLENIIEKLPPTEVVGNTNFEIARIVRATEAPFEEDYLAWVSEKNLDLLKTIPHGCVIISQAVPTPYLVEGCTYLKVPNPRLYFLNVVKEFFLEKDVVGISVDSVIDPSVKIGKNVTIHAGVVIEKNCFIGNETTIDANTVIKKGTVIGNRVKIGANNTIGGQGFGYEKDETGEFELIPHIGNVVIEDDVEIGNNTAIDRAVLGSTILRKNSKVDNLVHIAHGVEIGENSLIIANAMIAGSTIIGKNVWVAPSSSILNKLEVEDNAVIGMGAVVIRNVKAGQTIIGNPGKDLQQLKSK